MSEEKIYTVHEYLDLVNSMVSEINVVVEGEVSSLKRHPSGHIYFDLCEVKNGERAVFSCALWKFKAQYLSWELKEGKKVQVTGYADVYKQSGKYTFKIDKISPVGEGALKQAFEKLTKELQEKGFFLAEHKQSLPLFPENIALITSKSGAAINDFTTHLGQFGIKINLLDCRVEGINAINEIVNGISYLNQNFADIDLIVLTRGGGSLESLQAFNSYEVAQAIFSSRIPILSAIGHEDDITIADLVADRRASTPTDAGNIVSEGWRNAKNSIQLVSQFLSSRILDLIKDFRNNLEDLSESYDRNFIRILEDYKNTEDDFKKVLKIFRNRLIDKHEDVAYLDDSLNNLFGRLLLNNKTKLVYDIKQLNASDPTLKLKQGYSIIRDKENKIIKRIEDLHIDDQVKLQISNGVAQSVIQTIERH